MFRKRMLVLVIAMMSLGLSVFIAQATPPSGFNAALSSSSSFAGFIYGPGVYGDANTISLSLNFTGEGKVKYECMGEAFQEVASPSSINRSLSVDGIQDVECSFNWEEGYISIFGLSTFDPEVIGSSAQDFPLLNEHCRLPNSPQLRVEKHYGAFNQNNIEVKHPDGVLFWYNPEQAGFFDGPTVIVDMGSGEPVGTIMMARGLGQDFTCWWTDHLNWGE